MPAGVAVEIEDQRTSRRGRNAPREQALAILGLQTEDLGLESERRRVDLSGVTPKQDLALPEEKSDDHRGVERDADQDRDQHRAASPGATLSAAALSRSASVIFFASPKSISVLSRKNSSLSTPA